MGPRVVDPREWADVDLSARQKELVGESTFGER